MGISSNEFKSSFNGIAWDTKKKKINRVAVVDKPIPARQNTVFLERPGHGKRLVSDFAVKVKKRRKQRSGGGNVSNLLCILFFFLPKNLLCIRLSAKMRRCTEYITNK